jgi:hypothetical protein
MNLDFSQIKGRKVIVGGVQGKIAVKLVGFEVKPDSNGNPNYQFKLKAVDYTNHIEPYNCGESYYKGVVSNIGLQLGFEVSKEMDEEAILTKATKEVFYIWKQNGYTNFYDREAWLAEQRAKLTEEAPDL